MKKYFKQIFLKVGLCRNLPLSLQPWDYTPVVELKELPDAFRTIDRIPCNLNFDDLCPKYMDEFGLDFGGRVDKGLALEFGSLLQDYPLIAVTHFVIPFCMFQKKVSHFSRHVDGRYNIASPSHSEWLDYYKSLAETYNIEYALHGYYHWQFENLLFSRHTEFAFKSEEESREAIEMGLEIFHRAGLDTFGFRAPGWDINSDLSICRALKAVGMRYIAGSSLDGGFNVVRQRVSNIYPTLVDGLVSFPQNILLDWDIDHVRKEIDRIVEAKGMISIKGHFVDRNMTNSCSKENLSKLRTILDYLSEKYGDSVEYMTLCQIADRIQEINHDGSNPQHKTMGK